MPYDTTERFCGKTPRANRKCPQRLKPLLIVRHLRRGWKPRPFKTGPRISKRGHASSFSAASKRRALPETLLSGTFPAACVGYFIRGDRRESWGTRKVGLSPMCGTVVAAPNPGFGPPDFSLPVSALADNRRRACSAQNTVPGQASHSNREGVPRHWDSTVWRGTRTKSCLPVARTWARAMPSPGRNFRPGNWYRCLYSLLG